MHLKNGSQNVPNLSKSELLTKSFLGGLKVVFDTFLLVCFLSLNESTSQTRKNLFFFYFKSSFRSGENL